MEVTKIIAMSERVFFAIGWLVIVLTPPRLKLQLGPLLR
jgi:hypothetical protein